VRSDRQWRRRHCGGLLLRLWESTKAKGGREMECERWGVTVEGLGLMCHAAARRGLAGQANDDARPPRGKQTLNRLALLR